MEAEAIISVIFVKLEKYLCAIMKIPHYAEIFNGKSVLFRLKMIWECIVLKLLFKRISENAYIKMSAEMYRKFHTGQEVNTLDYMTVLEKRLNDANEGRMYWNRLVKELSIGDGDVVIALLSRDMKCAGIVLYYGTYLKRFKGYKNIYVITDSEELLKRAQSVGWADKIICCTGVQMKQLELLYQLYKFSGQFIWGTLRDIEDADGTRLAGVNGISLEDIIATAVLDLPFDECRG